MNHHRLGTAHPPPLPMVTVIIPCYNHETYVAEAIESVIRQTYARIELIVVNDGSTDRSGGVILSMEDECQQRFLRYEYIDQENKGVSATLNLALGLANGEYVSFLASDDRFSPRKIEVLMSAMLAASESISLAFGDARFVDAEGNALPMESHGRAGTTFIEHYEGSRSGVRGTYSSLIRGNYIPAMAVLVRRSDLAAVGGFDEGSLVEDWPVWLKLARTAELLHIDEVVAYYRWHGSNTVITQQAALQIDCARVLRKEMQHCQDEAGLQTIWFDAFAGRVIVLLSLHRFRAVLSLVRGVPKIRLMKLVGPEIARSIGRRFAAIFRTNR